PVQACPPSAGYRLRKFVRRNRGPVLAAALVLLALVGGIMGTTWGLVEAVKRAEGERLAKVAAEKAESKERAQRLLAQTNERRANEQKQIAQAVLDFLQDKLLRQASSHAQGYALARAGGASFKVTDNPTVRDLLDRAAAELTPGQIEKQFPGQPL